MKILVAGTPCTGKTTLSRKLSEELGCEHIDVSEFVRARKIYETYIKDLDTYEFDAEEVSCVLRDHLSAKSKFVVDTHSVDTVSGVKFDHIFVLRVPSDVLYKRLHSRGYSEEKIRENVECEIFGVVEEECLELFPKESISLIHSNENTQPSHTYMETLSKLKTIFRFYSF